MRNGLVRLRCDWKSGSEVVQSLSRVLLFVTPWIAAPGFPVLHYLPEFVQNHVHWIMMPSNHLILCCIPFFFYLQSLPVSWVFTSGGQSIGASASVLPMNIQGWFPLGLTGLISLQSKGLSRVFSSTIIRKHQFFSTQSFLWSKDHGMYWVICTTVVCGCGVFFLFPFFR